MSRRSSYDDSWARLSWIAPASFLLSFAALYGFLRLTLAHSAQPPKPRTVSVSIVELPAPAVTQPAAPTPPQEVQPLKPEPLPEPKKSVAKPVAKVPVAQPTPVEQPPETPPPPSVSQSVQVPSGGTISARAIYKPIPEVPEELRRQNVDVVAVARFHVHTDGKADFELLQATPIPALNSALLDKLKTWRFFPALQDGKPVDSTIDLRIPITVQ